VPQIHRAQPTPDNPSIAILTPGIYNSAYFEHSFLARQMGVELVEGRGSAGGQRFHLYMRTTRGCSVLTCLYRRVDDDFLDPLCFRPKAPWAVAGLMNAYRIGTPGAGQRRRTVRLPMNKAIYPFVPDMIKFYLAQEPNPAQCPHIHLRRRPGSQYVLEHLDELGRQKHQRIRRLRHLMAISRPRKTPEIRGVDPGDPRNYSHSPSCSSASIPAWWKTTSRAARRTCGHTILYGQKVIVMPGGLTRVALRKGSLVVNQQPGGGARYLGAGR